MKTKLVTLCILLVSILFTFPQVQSNFTAGDINSWCDQTGFPEPCKYHMHKPLCNNASTTLTRKEFLTLLEQEALDHAISTLNFTKTLEPKSVGDAEKSALSDCVKLYDSAILSLHKTLDVTLNPKPIDTQTWLSAASSSFEYCQNGFFDVNMTTNIYPLVMSNNVTKLISDCLAINKVSYDQEIDGIDITNPGEYPLWFTSDNLRADYVVAQDGSGNCKTIKEALEASRSRKDESKRFIIHVKGGTYKEHLEVDMKSIVLIGDGIGRTIITRDLSSKGNYSIHQSPTVTASGDGFMARDITFQNTAGPEGEQAVAFKSGSDRSVIYRCSFEGYQDTLFVFTNRQFYRECDIYGTVDFIFGTASAVFQNCKIYARKPRNGGGLCVTAQGRNNTNETSGISIQNSKFAAAIDLKPYVKQIKAFLGRPWGEYSRVVYLETFLDSLVDPKGWKDWWPNPKIYEQLFYGEYKNSGPSSNTSGRVRWRGYHVIQNKGTAEMFSVAKFIQGQEWLPGCGVRFNPGL